MKPAIFLPILLPALALAPIACGKGPKTTPGPGPAVAAPLRAPSDVSETARREKVTLWREVPATVRSLDHIQVSAEVSGRIVRVRADVGDRVEAGQLMAAIDPAPLISARDSARAALDLAQVEYQRIQRLREQEVSSQQELDAAASALKQARARLDIAETALSKTDVTSPVRGVVEARLVGPGDLALPGKPLYSLYDPQRLCLETHLPVSDRDHAALGTPLKWALEGVEGEAGVSEVAPSSDPASRTVRIRVPIAPDGAGLPEEPAPGMFGTLRYRVGEQERVSVSKKAVFRVGELEMVEVLENGRWARRAVRTGASDGGRVEILAGLRGGEEVKLP